MQQELQDGRDDADDRDALRADTLEEPVGMETLVHDHARARVERGDERRHDAVNVVQREDAHHPLIVGQLVPFRDRHPVHEEVVVRERHALGVARGAGGVHDQGVVVRPGFLVGDEPFGLSFAISD